MSTMKPANGRYGQSALNERGDAEDPTRCVDEVWNGPRGMTSSQCRRRRGHGPDGEWCRQHAKQQEARLGGGLRDLKR